MYGLTKLTEIIIWLKLSSYTLFHPYLIYLFAPTVSLALVEVANVASPLRRKGPADNIYHGPRATLIRHWCEGVHGFTVSWHQSSNTLLAACLLPMRMFLVLRYVYSKQLIFGLTQEWLREMSFSYNSGESTTGPLGPGPPSSRGPPNSQQTTFVGHYY